MKRIFSPRAALALLVLLPLSARAGFEWGGCRVPDHSQNLRLAIGAVTEFEGMVSETTRRYYDVAGRPESQADAESYGTSDFNMDGPYGAIGLSCDALWGFIGFRLDTLFLSPSVSTTAKRDYYIEVGDDIEYQGNSYDQMKIPAGTDFDAELTGNMTELDLSLVPFGFQSDDFLRINPSLDFGVLFFGGSYEIDAGEPTGVVQYQSPPEDFVVGGKSGGFLGLALPQWGPGIDLRIGAAEGVQASLQAHYLFFNYDGSSLYLTTADHREKNVDVEHRNLRIRGQIEFPMRRGALNVGLQVQMIETEGSVTSQETDPEEILAARERFDKDFTFTLTSVLATIGITF